MSAREVVCRACGTQRAALTEAMAAAWDEGFEAGENMAHLWGHVDHWEDAPANPHRADAIAQTAPTASQEGEVAPGAAEDVEGAQIEAERPCRGQNSNVCVAEGCYGEACIR